MSLWRPARERRALGDIGNPLIPARPDSRATAGVYVTPDTAMTLASVWACVRLRADLVSTLPLVCYRDDPSGVPQEIPPTPFLQAPGGARVTLDEWLYMSQVSLDLRGNAFGIIKNRDGFGYPTQIELLHPDMVVVTVSPTTGAYSYLVAGREVNPDDVYHERQFVSPGEPLGLSPITYHARTIGVALAAERFGADWFADGAHPSAILQTDQRIDDKDAKTLKQRFIEAARGSREPMVLGAGVKYQAIQVTPNESQFLDTMRYSATQVARIFGITPEYIGGDSGASMQYTNVEARALDLLRYGMGPTFVRREKAISRILPGNAYVRYDLKELLRTDAETRYKTHAIGIAAKFLAPDEARSEEGKPPLTAAQKAVLDLVPLTVTPMGTPKALPNPATGDDGEEPPATPSKK